MKLAAPAVKEGFTRYLDAAREHELARAVQD
jgi:hypothetical protein